MKKLGLPLWIVIGMLVGAAAGALLQKYVPADAMASSALYQAFDGIASIFLRLLRLIVVPLVVFSLLSGMLGMGDVLRLGRLGGKTFGYYLLTSLIAVVTGLIWVNLIGPGRGLTIDIPTQAVEKDMPSSFWEVLLNLVPSNFFQAMAEMDLFGVIFFTVLFGAFLLTLKGERFQTLNHAIEGCAEIMMRMTQFIIALAPIGIAALIARMVASTGLGVFLELKGYIVTVVLALLTHVLVGLPLLVWLRTRRNPYRLLLAMAPALLTGISTASSSGTLSVTMERAEKDAGISNEVASFVLPVGATVNMDGTALYEIVTVLFIAQLHASVDPTFSLGFGQQLLVVFLGLAVSVGAAGIPHAGLVMMVIILQAVGLPVEYTALIWAVDRPLDMMRTAVNIAGDSSVAFMIADGEGELDEQVFLS